MSPDATRTGAVRRGSQGDLGFRLGTGAFAVLVITIVAAIGAVLISESWLSIQKFGLGFWQTTTWDPVAGDFGALPFIWGTLYSSILALLIATPVALGIAIFIAELCPARLRMPLVFQESVFAATPMNGALRLAGTMEFVGFEHAVAQSKATLDRLFERLVL